MNKLMNYLFFLKKKFMAFGYIYSEKELFITLKNKKEKSIRIKYQTKYLPPLKGEEHLKYLVITNTELRQLPIIDNLANLENLLILESELKQLQEHIKEIKCKGTINYKFPKWLNYSNIISRP